MVRLVSTLLLALASGGLAACAEAGSMGTPGAPAASGLPAAATPGKAATAGCARVHAGGVTACVDLSLGTPRAAVVAARPQEGPFWTGGPAHVQIYFDGYPTRGEAEEPTVWVYVYSEVRAFSDLGRTVTDAIEASLGRSVAPTAGTPAYPLMPPVNATQAFQVKVRPLEASWGRGVRWVTQIGQNPAPVDASNVTYSAILVSSDRRWLVSARFPVTTPALPARAPTPDQAFFDRFTQYVGEVARRLDVTPDTDWRPQLDALDRLLTSLELPAAPPIRG